MAKFCTTYLLITYQKNPVRIILISNLRQMSLRARNCVNQDIFDGFYQSYIDYENYTRGIINSFSPGKK